MECPHCKYVNGWNPEIQDHEKGKEGNFFRLPIKVERNYYGGEETKKVYGCPKCNKIFMEE